MDQFCPVRHERQLLGLWGKIFNSDKKRQERKNSPLSIGADASGSPQHTPKPALISATAMVLSNGCFDYLFTP